MSRQELENVRAGTSLIRVTISCEAIRSARYRMKGAGSWAWAEINAKDRGFTVAVVVYH